MLSYSVVRCLLSYRPVVRAKKGAKKIILCRSVACRILIEPLSTVAVLAMLCSTSARPANPCALVYLCSCASFRLHLHNAIATHINTTGLPAGAQNLSKKCPDTGTAPRDRCPDSNLRVTFRSRHSVCSTEYIACPSATYFFHLPIRAGGCSLVLHVCLGPCIVPSCSYCPTIRVVLYFLFWYGTKL